MINNNYRMTILLAAITVFIFSGIAASAGLPAMPVPAQSSPVEIEMISRSDAMLFWLFGGASGILLCVILLYHYRNRNYEKKLEEANSLISEYKEKLDQLEDKLDELEEDNKKISEELETNKKVLGKKDKTIENLRQTVNSESFDGRLPVCSHCKDIRDAKGFWHPIEEYLECFGEIDFSHTICPTCAKKFYPDMFKDGTKPFSLTWKQK